MFIGAVLFSTSVSFASDGPKTTKECVVSYDDVMETSFIADQDVLSATNVAVWGTVTNLTSVITMAALDSTFIESFATIDRRVFKMFNVDYGLPSLHLFNHYRNSKTNKIAYKFIDKNCRTRELTKNFSC